MGSVSHQRDKAQNHLGDRLPVLPLREYILSITLIDVEEPPNHGWDGFLGSGSWTV